MAIWVQISKFSISLKKRKKKTKTNKKNNKHKQTNQPCRYIFGYFAVKNEWPFGYSFQKFVFRCKKRMTVSVPAFIFIARS